MASPSLSGNYSQQRHQADWDELNEWRRQVLSQPPEPAPTAAPTAPTQPAAAPRTRTGPLAALGPAASAYWETFQAGAQNIADAIYSKTPQSVGTSVGQGALGALQMLGSLGAGAGAYVREAIKDFAPGKEASVAIPGGPNSPAARIRATFALPALLMDPNLRDPNAPKGQGFFGFLDPNLKNPREIEEGLNQPITYGELVDIVTQFVTPAGTGVAALRAGGKKITARGLEPVQARGGAAAAAGPPAAPAAAAAGPPPTPAAPDVSMTRMGAAGAAEAPRAAPAPQGGEVITMDVLKARAGVPGAGAAAGAPAPSPGAAPRTMQDLMAQKMGEGKAPEGAPAPEAAAVPMTAGDVAMALRQDFERRPYESPPTLVEGVTRTPEGGLVDVFGKPIEAPVARALDERARLRAFERTRFDQPSRRMAAEAEGPAPQLPEGATIGTAIETALTKTEDILRQVQEETRLKAAEGKAQGEVTPKIEAGEFTGREFGGADPRLLARMLLGAVAGGAAGDTPEEQILGAAVGLGVGASLNRSTLSAIAKAYKESGLADERGVIDFSKWRARRRQQPGEEAIQPNYARLVTTPELTRFSKNLHRMMKDEIIERGGPAKSHDATLRAAQEMISEGKMTAERILTLENTAMLTREEAVAARMIGNRSRAYSKNLNDAYKAGKVTGEELVDAFSVAAAISKNVRVAQKRIAQAQEGSKIRVDFETPSVYRPDDLIHLADDLGKNATPEQLSKALDSVERSLPMERVHLAAAVFPRAFLEVMYFEQLSGMAQATNIVGGLTMAPLAIVTHGISPVMPSWSKGPSIPGTPWHVPVPSWSHAGQGVMPNVGAHMWMAYQESMLDMFQLLKFWDPEARARLKGLEEEVGGGRQMERRWTPAISSENFGGGKAMDFVGATIRAPGRVLGTVDAMMKMVNARMWQRFEAIHQASREGHTGADWGKRVDDLMNNIELLSDPTRERIQDFAERQTFTKDFEPSATTGRDTAFSWLQRGPENEWINGIFRWQIMPYFRTQTRAMETGLQHTPGLNFTMAQFWRDMTGPTSTVQTQQIAQGKLAFGFAALGLFSYLESQAWITGDLPDDPKLRQMWENEQGVQARSWWDPVAGKWRSYAGIPVLEHLIAAGANMSAAARRAPGDLGAKLLAGGLAMGSILDYKDYTGQLSEWLEVVREGTTDDTRVEKFFAKMGRDVMGMVQPGALREIEKGVDPTIRRARPSGAYPEGSIPNALLRELDVMGRDWMSHIPGLSSMKDADGAYFVPPDRDRIDGQPIVGETAPYFPFKSMTPVKDDLKFHIFYELQGAGLPPWPEYIGGGRQPADVGLGSRPAENVAAGVHLDRKEKDAYPVIFTQIVRDGLGRTYRQALQAAYDDPFYRDELPDIGPSGTPKDSEKAKWLQRIHKDFHELTVAHMRANSAGLDADLRYREQEREVRKVPTRRQPEVREMLKSVAPQIAR